MIPAIEEYYQKIAEFIAEDINDDWATARTDQIFFPGSITSFGEYTTSSGSLKHFEVSWNIIRTFMELRAKFKEAGSPLWGQATFDLTSEGKFSMTWGYENCDENGDTIFDEEREHQREETRRLRLVASD